MGETRTGYRILLLKYYKADKELENTMKMDLRGRAIDCDDGRWMKLARDRVSGISGVEPLGSAITVLVLHNIQWQEIII
jgi:hypothetical protein